MQYNLVSQYLSSTLQSYLVEKLFPQSEQETLNQAEECLRFLYLSSFTEGSIPVNSVIDEIWHLLILQTQEYFELCQSLPGKKFIHHTSDIYMKYFILNAEKSPSLVADSEVDAQRQLEWLVSYVFNFGDFTKENITYWSFAKALCEKFQFSVEQLNSQLKSLLVTK